MTIGFIETNQARNKRHLGSASQPRSILLSMKTAFYEALIREFLLYFLWLYLKVRLVGLLFLYLTKQ